MRSSYRYRERDYTFGNLCLTLRTRIGVTQGELAQLLKAGERTIQDWEGGSSYPKVESLKRFIEVCARHHVFAASREEEEIRALWQTARQRVLLDENWLRTLLSSHSAVAHTSTTETNPVSDLPAASHQQKGQLTQQAELEQVPVALVQQKARTASSPPLLDSLTSSSVTDSWLQEHLLATKFFVPSTSRVLIPRPRLNALLDESKRYLLTLVSAPAGFGKTTMLTAWVQSLQEGHPSVAWVSLDEGDNDPVRFWRYVLTSLDRALPGLCTQLLTYLQNQPSPPFEYLLTALINRLIEGTDRVLLVLDDYHLVSSEVIHTTLMHLVEHLPPQLHLILSTRVDPPLPLARLRARRQMLEVRTEQLRSTLEEAAAFLEEIMSVQLPLDSLEAVNARTEGWLVGLQLFGLSLRGRADPVPVLPLLSGSQRYILDYLTEEVLRQQPESIQTFLLRTSVLEQLSASLCDTVLQQSGSQQILEQLERANLFVSPLDEHRRWYRYHALFAETLRTQLEREDVEVIPALHLRASHWYEQQGHIGEAVQQALQAKAWQYAADLIEPAATSLIWKRSESLMLCRWIEQIPQEVVRSRPRLCFVYAWVQFFLVSPTAAEPWMRAAETALAIQREAGAMGLPVEESGQDNLIGEILTLRALSAVVTGDAQAGRALSQQALVHLSEANLFARREAIGVQADAYGILGDLVLATQSALEAVALAPADESVSQTLHNMSRAIQYLYYRGRLREAWRIAQQADPLGRGSDNLLFPLMSSIYFFQSYIPREWNQLDLAFEIARQSIQLSQREEFSTVAYIGFTALLEVHLAQGDLVTAAVALEQAERILVTQLQDSWFLRALFLTEAKVRFWLACGETERAAQWIEEQLRRSDRLPAPLARAREDLAQVRVWLAQQKAEEVLRRLEPLLEEATTRDWGNFVIGMRLLEALAHQMRKSEREALASLAQAARLAEPEGYLRCFLDEGPPMATLLSRLRERQSRQGPTPYLDSVLAAFPYDKEKLDEALIHPPLA